MSSATKVAFNICTIATYINNLSRNKLVRSVRSKPLILLQQLLLSTPLPPFPRQDPWTDLERFIHGFSITGRDRTSLIREGNRIEAIRKGAGPRGMHAVVVSDKGVRSVRCTPVGGRECPVRDPPPPSPLAERQYPSCDTPSYDPGFRVSRAAPGGERPRLTQTQNRSPFVALLATSPPRNPLSLPLPPLSLALPQGGSSHS